MTSQQQKQPAGLAGIIPIDMYRMINFRSLLQAGAALILVTILAGCGGPDIPSDTGPPSLPFSLAIPGNRPKADYYATSGVMVRMVSVKVGDSVVDSPQSSYYAQFTTEPGSTPPQSVTLNGTALERHRDTDTLRLGSGAPQTVLSDNAWEIIDPDNTKSSFRLQKIDVVDTVAPFNRRSTVRGDTSLTLGWRRPSLISSAFHINWTTNADTLNLVANDAFGEFTISRADMAKVRGKGRVILTRYYYVEGKHKGKSVGLMRIAQRTFDIEVL